ncbi:hypothetical protein A0U40_09885 [[Bacillus] sp. KCTC 13219]|nr:hypothetical protein A0U40_09885 [[Bacillus] sp. KCTC 13219]
MNNEGGTEMNTLIIYDAEGYVIQSITGSYRVPTSIPYLEVEIPENKMLRLGVGIDVTVEPHQPIFEDIPKSEVELLKDENTTLKLAVAELAEAQEQTKIETQIALAELAESLVGGV